jgi:hypothetical protein
MVLENVSVYVDDLKQVVYRASGEGELEML